VPIYDQNDFLKMYECNFFLGKFKLERVDLETSRVMIVRDIRLSDWMDQKKCDKDSANSLQKVMEILEKEVQSMLSEAEKKLKNERSPDAPTLPMLRLRVEKEIGFPPVNVLEFAKKFKGKTANNDVLLLKKDKTVSVKTDEKKMDQNTKEALRCERN
jgi:hypothetical protein